MSCIHKTHVKFPIEYISVIKPEIPKTPEAFGKDPFRQTPGNAFIFSSNKGTWMKRIGRDTWKMELGSLEALRRTSRTDAETWKRTHENE